MGSELTGGTAKLTGGVVEALEFLYPTMGGGPTHLGVQMESLSQSSDFPFCSPVPRAFRYLIASVLGVLPLDITVMADRHSLLGCQALSRKPALLLLYTRWCAGSAQQVILIFCCRNGGAEGVLIGQITNDSKCYVSGIGVSHNSVR